MSERCEYLNTKDKFTCYGCGACEIVCSVGAIEMNEDIKGFKYPLLHSEKCVECGKCKEVCSYSKETGKSYSHSLYSVQNKSFDVLEHCQSGGVFDAISDLYIKNNGVVYGSILKEDELSVRHVRSADVELRNKMRGSKYVKSELSKDTIEQIKIDLEFGRDVLFTGTPCQCAGINALYSNYENLCTLEILCHGTPSKILLKKYIEWFETMVKTKIKKIYFRVQKWKSPYLHVMLIEDIENKQFFNTDYSALYYSHLGHREICLKCGFANKNRQADITIGDFWDRDLFENFGNKYGVSMCIVNTEKGKKIFEKAKKSLAFQEVSYNNIFKQQPCLYHSLEIPNNYDEFWSGVSESEFDEIATKYFEQRLYDKYHLGNKFSINLLKERIDL